MKIPKSLKLPRKLKKELKKSFTLNIYNSNISQLLSTNTNVSIVICHGKDCQERILIVLFGSLRDRMNLTVSVCALLGFKHTANYNISVTQNPLCCSIYSVTTYTGSKTKSFRRLCKYARKEEKRSIQLMYKNMMKETDRQMEFMRGVDWNTPLYPTFL